MGVWGWMASRHLICKEEGALGCVERRFYESQSNGFGSIWSMIWDRMTCVGAEILCVGAGVDNGCG